VANDAALDYRSMLESERHSLEEQLQELGHGESGKVVEYDSNFADSSQVMARTKRSRPSCKRPSRT
jgi:hypothetical protein